MTSAISSILDAISGSAILVFDLNLRTVAANEFFNGRFEALRPEWEPLCLRALEGEKSELRESSYEICISPVRSGGRITGGMVVVRDISSELEREEKVRRNEVFLKAMLDNMPACVYAKDLEGRYILANEGFIKSMGLTVDDMMGRTDMEVFSREMAAACKESDRMAIESGRSVQAEETIPIAGKMHTFLSSKFPLRDANGNIHLVCGVSTDITDRKRAAQELEAERARSIFSAKMATLGEMAAGIAHEINNPLAIIHARAAQVRLMLKHGTFDERQLTETCERIEATTMRISKIVRGLRSFAKDGEQDPFQRISLDLLLNDTFELCRERFRSHSIRLDLCRVPDDVFLECRPVQIAQVLLNLLNNAYDAVQSLPDRWVAIDVDRRPGWLALSVTDSGKGIPEELREKVMQPFFSTKGPGRGTGLGLSISRGIIESHRGKLWIDSRHSNTRFVIELPLSV